MTNPDLARYNPKTKRWQYRRLRNPRRTIRLWVWFLWCVMLGAVVGLALFAWVSRDLPTPEGIVHRAVPQSTKIYDRTGTILLYDIHGESRRTAVPLTNIPNTLKLATLTAEDRNFYEHRGFRFVSMLRALIVNLIRGNRAQGGSTITQQFIKNAILGNKKSYFRKVRELILAYQIERKFSKDEILKLYFNEIPYGSNAYGAEAAAQLVFGKSVQDVSLSEATILAALPQAPSRYSPWGPHLDELIARQHYILDAMSKIGHITKEEAEKTKKIPLVFNSRHEQIIAPHFVFYIKDLLTNKYGDRVVEQGGFKIITTLDVEKQEWAEAAIASSKKKNDSFNAHNASLVALDTKNGQLLAMVGSRDYFDNQAGGQVNVSVRPRQPGSSFKPIVYATALSLGFKPETKLFDVVTVFKTDTKDYSPHNYDDKEHGIVSLRQALAGSLNIPAVKLLYLTGVDKVLEFAQRLGYTTLGDRSRFGLSLVLGGGEVKLLEHTNVYATFAREGVAKPVSAILKIESVTGEVLEEFHDSNGFRIFEEQTSRELSSILSDNEARSFVFGAQNHLILPDRAVAAKTGTTNDYRDAWTLGYTPSLAVGVWVGNNDNSEMKRGADGSVVAAPIWQNFLIHATKNQPVEAFVAPTERIEEKPILNGELGNIVLEIDSVSGLLATELTPTEFKIKKTFPSYHTILHYISPGNPRGPVPPNPLLDPQYERWETPIQLWAQNHNLIDSLPPTEFDNVHVEQNRPRVKIISPDNSAPLASPPTIRLDIQGGRPTSRVIYFVDDLEIISVTSASPITLPITLSTGFHTLRVLVTDNMGNAGEDKINFNFQP